MQLVESLAVVAAMGACNICLFDRWWDVLFLRLTKIFLRASSMFYFVPRRGANYLHGGSAVVRLENTGGVCLYTYVDIYSSSSSPRPNFDTALPLESSPGETIGL